MQQLCWVCFDPNIVEGECVSLSQSTSVRLPNQNLWDPVTLSAHTSRNRSRTLRVWFSNPARPTPQSCLCNPALVGSGYLILGRSMSISSPWRSNGGSGIELGCAPEGFQTAQQTSQVEHLVRPPIGRLAYAGKSIRQRGT